jgi:hypothetical protein
MLCILRYQTLKRPLRWSAKPLAQSIRPLSQRSIWFLRRASGFRQEEPVPSIQEETALSIREEPAPSIRDKVEPLDDSNSFYEKGKPRIRKQVIVSRVTLLFPLQPVSLKTVLGRW